MPQDSDARQQIKYDHYCDYIHHIVLHYVEFSLGGEGSSVRIEMSFGDKVTIRIWRGIVSVSKWIDPGRVPLPYPEGTILTPDIRIVKYLVKYCPNDSAPTYEAHYRRPEYKHIRLLSISLPMSFRMIATRLNLKRNLSDLYNAIVSLDRFDHEQSVRNETLIGLFFEPFKRELRRWRSPIEYVKLDFHEWSTKKLAVFALRIQKMDQDSGSFIRDFGEDCGHQGGYLDWLSNVYPYDRIVLIQDKLVKRQYGYDMIGEPIHLYSDVFEEFVERRSLARMKKTDEDVKLYLLTRQFKKLFVLYDLLMSSPIHEHDRIKALRASLGVDGGYNDDDIIGIIGAKIVLLIKGIF